MECNVTKQAVVVNEVAFDGLAEQSLECDIILPDYCPDIVKILKCELNCCVTGTQASGNTLELTGVGTASVLYMSDDNPAGTMEIRSIDYKVPYVKNCELKSQAVNPVIDLSVKTDYVNCRAVSKRRVEVRGAVSHKIRVVNCAEQQMVSNAEGMGVQLKKDMLEMTGCVTQNRSNLTVKEELELGQGKPSIASIITSRCFAVLTDYKVISGKIVTKGDLHICVLYYSAGEGSGANKMETMEYSLPISQIVDAAGADDECACNVQYQVGSCDVQPKTDLDGDNRIVSVEAEVVVDATVHKKNQLPLSSDCYCTGYECAFQSVPINLMTLIDSVHDTHMYKGTVELPEGIRGILNGWSRVCDQAVKIEKGQITVDFKLNICLIAVDSEGVVQFYDKSEDVSHVIHIQSCCDQPVFLPNIIPISMTYSMGSGMSSDLEVRSEILISGCVYCMMRRNAICDVTVDESKPKSRDNNCALTIYYADKGESLWDIAKRYNTAIDAVLKENNFQETMEPSTGCNADSDQLTERTMLLIPMV